MRSRGRPASDSVSIVNILYFRKKYKSIGKKYFSVGRNVAEYEAIAPCTRPELRASADLRCLYAGELLRAGAAAGQPSRTPAEPIHSPVPFCGAKTGVKKVPPSKRRDSCGRPAAGSFAVGYLAYATARVSRMTVILT